MGDANKRIRVDVETSHENLFSVRVPSINPDLARKAGAESTTVCFHPENPAAPRRSFSEDG